MPAQIIYSFTSNSPSFLHSTILSSPNPPTSLHGCPSKFNYIFIICYLSFLIFYKKVGNDNIFLGSAINGIIYRLRKTFSLSNLSCKGLVSKISWRSKSGFLENLIERMLTVYWFLQSFLHHHRFCILFHIVEVVFMLLQCLIIAIKQLGDLSGNIFWLLCLIKML